jgi:AcrR family transcriptional regulator
MASRRPRTSPRRTPRQRRAEDTVAVLLEATERVVARLGYHATTTNHIAETAGVSIGTLYHYFPSKEALIEAVVHRMWGEELDALRASANALATRPLAEGIDVIIGALVSAVAQKLELYRRWYGEASHLGQLGVGLEMTDVAVRIVRDTLVRHREEVWPEDLDFAADLVVKTALAVVRTATRDYPTQIASGALTRELGAMIRRYLLRANG